MMILLVLGVLQTALIRPYYRNDRLKTIEVLADTIIDELLENGNVSKANTDAAFKSILNNRACAYMKLSVRHLENLMIMDRLFIKVMHWERRACLVVK